MPPTTSNEFWQKLEKSGLMDLPQIQEATERLQKNGGVPEDPQELARRLIADRWITPFHAEHLLAGRHKGFFLGKYKILGRLGAGGMGHVYLAQHTVMRRPVAIKVLPKTKGFDPSSIARFQREARAIATLNHPNIVQAYDIDQDGPVHYLVMEYVEGMSIQDYVRRLGPIPFGQAADYVCQAALGLEHAGQLGIVHRDIKPANLLVDAAGNLKLLDMGLAVFFEERDEEALTLANEESILGTADYLAPEQALDSHNVDIRADIYSLGATFYYMLTGGPPFPNGTIAQKLMYHQQKDPPPIRERTLGVPEEINVILRHMMAKKREDRFQQPSEVVAALASFVEHVEHPLGADWTPGPLAGHWGGPSSSASQLARSSSAVARLAPSRSSAGNSAARSSAKTALTAGRPKSEPVAELVADDEQSAVDLFAAIASSTQLPARTVVAPKPKIPLTLPLPSVDRRWMWIGGGVATLVLIGAGLFVVLPRRTPPKSEVALPSAPAAASVAPTNELLVSKAPGAPFLLIEEAIAEARSGQTVKVAERPGGWPVQTLKLTPDRVGKVMLAGLEPTVVLQSASGFEPPILRIDRTREVTVRNLVLDGGGRPGPLIEITGPEVFGIVLDHLTLRNYQGPGIRIEAADGVANQPLVISDVLFQPGGNEGPRAVGILFQPAAGGAGFPTSQVRIEKCTFQNIDAAVQVADEVQSLVIDRCLFENTLAALKISSKKSDPARIWLTGSSFDRMTKPVVSEVGEAAARLVRQQLEPNRPQAKAK